jgi:isopentenyl-diphosphate Delta-isomerase
LQYPLLNLNSFLMTFEEVILVDENDRETGTAEKMEAHRKGLLHRAFAVFVVDSHGRLLLQKRASGKYHSPGLWTNTCCSHPRPGESVDNAAVRRLQEEMGINCTLSESFTFIYRADFDNGLTEHEFDHVLIGLCDNNPVPDHREVENYKYINLDHLSADIEKNPGNYTVWFRIAYPKVKDILKNIKT